MLKNLPNSCSKKSLLLCSFACFYFLKIFKDISGTPEFRLNFCRDTKRRREYFLNFYTTKIRQKFLF